jgi:hypothetical protein
MEMAEDRMQTGSRAASVEKRVGTGRAYVSSAISAELRSNINRRTASPKRIHYRLFQSNSFTELTFRLLSYLFPKVCQRAH